MVESALSVLTAALPVCCDLKAEFSTAQLDPLLIPLWHPGCPAFCSRPREAASIARVSGCPGRQGQGQGRPGFPLSEFRAGGLAGVRPVLGTQAACVGGSSSESHVPLSFTYLETNPGKVCSGEL